MSTLIYNNNITSNINTLYISQLSEKSNFRDTSGNYELQIGITRYKSEFYPLAFSQYLRLLTEGNIKYMYILYKMATMLRCQLYSFF